MRRLEIVLVGHSLTLSELNNELATHGHQVQLFADPMPATTLLIQHPSLVIDDGTLERPDTGGHTHLSLRVGIGQSSELGLPRLELLCWYGSTAAQRLIARQWLDPQSTGNGRMLRDAAVAALVDMAALQVSRYSRDSGYFSSVKTAEPPQSEIQLGLDAVDRFLFEHRFNQTAQPHLLTMAERPLLERLEESLQVHAGRPALTFAGQSISYRELHALSLGIAQQLLSLIADQPAGKPAVIGICLPKSPALFAGVLAILGCGAIYLPLDPGQPLQRQQYILENAGATLLLHDGQHPLAAAGFAALDISRIEPRQSASPLVAGSGIERPRAWRSIPPAPQAIPKASCSVKETSVTSPRGMPNMSAYLSRVGCCNSRP